MRLEISNSIILYSNILTILLNVYFTNPRISEWFSFISTHYLMSAACRDRADNVRDLCLMRMRRGRIGCGGLI